MNVSETGTQLLEEKDFKFKQLLPAEELTADFVNKGFVLMYYKSSSGIIFPIDRADNEGILDSDADGQSFEFYPGFLFKDQYLSFLCVGSSSTSVAFTDRINNNGSAVRYVLLPGLVPGRSMTDLKNMPYSEIAKLYNITD